MSIKKIDCSNINSNEKNILRLLEEVKDPEIPVLTINDLGILRKIEFIEEEVVITITPTYSGCPAMDMIRDDIVRTLNKYGYDNITINTSLFPAWTTDWMTEKGKKKLKKFGIAPPNKTNCIDTILCPLCSSEQTKLVSEYGSTACKSMYRCETCKEPFCYFKAI